MDVARSFGVQGCILKRSKDFCYFMPCMAHLLKVKLTYTKTFLNLKAHCGHDYKAKTIKKQTYAKHRSVQKYLNTT
jgi:hypothetical protein